MHSLSVRTLEYFYIRVEDQPSSAYGLLQILASEEVKPAGVQRSSLRKQSIELTSSPIGDASHAATKHGWTLSPATTPVPVPGDDRTGRARRDSEEEAIDAGVEVSTPPAASAPGMARPLRRDLFKEGDHIAAQALEPDRAARATPPLVTVAPRSSPPVCSRAVRSAGVRWSGCFRSSRGRLRRRANRRGSAHQPLSPNSIKPPPVDDSSSFTEIWREPVAVRIDLTLPGDLYASGRFNPPGL